MGQTYVSCAPIFFVHIGHGAAAFYTQHAFVASSSQSIAG